MARPVLRNVVLPGGDTVTISDQPEKWWTEKNASGYVDPHKIAPDPKNPRRHMSPARLEELNESIKARGVRQQLVVTPRTLAPWASVDPKFDSCFFLAVGGHRRRNGAISGDVPAVPIKVVIYPSEKEHRMDMSLLNKGQDDLTPLEEGYEIVELQRLGWKVDELSKSFGLALPQLYGRMNLTKLHQDIQAMLDPELPRERRLPITTAGQLGGVKTPTVEELESLFKAFSELVSWQEISTSEDIEGMSGDDRRFALQKLLLGVIKKRNLSSGQAIEFIRERTLSLGAHRSASGKKTERYQPQRRKEIIRSLIKEVTGSVVGDWKPDEMRRIFELTSYEETDDFVNQMKSAQDFFEGLAKVISKIRDAKKRSHPEVLRLAAHSH